MQHSEKSHTSTRLNVLFVNSVLHFTKFRASTSPGACTVIRDSHVRSEFKKESDNGTSVASDPVRDPCNVHVVVTPEMILYMNCPFHQQHTNTLEYKLRLGGPKNNVNAPSMFRITRFKYLFIAERVCSVKMRVIENKTTSFNRQTS